MMASIDADRVVRRSQLYRWHRRHNAVFTEQADAVFVGHYGSGDQETSTAERLGICDLSLLPREGIIGPESTAWLATNNYEVPPRPNTASTQANGDLMARLSEQEYLCLRVSALANSMKAAQVLWPEGQERHVFAAPRADSHCLFAVTGAHAAEMFSTLCGVDLRAHKFADGNVAQTSVARVNAIVVRHELLRTNNFFVLTATSAAEYLWQCLIDASDKFSGEPIGVAALRAISTHRS